MKIISVVGARPQFVKLRPVSRALRALGVDEFVLHTGQHYDAEMSARFFDELRLPPPDENLGVHGPHGGQSGKSGQGGQGVDRAAQAVAMIDGIGRVIARERPDRLVVFGDTTSTLGGALAGLRAGVPVAHVEAGMRSFNPEMPEELNRIVADRASDLLFAASAQAARHLEAERLPGAIHLVGDVMLDVVREVLAGVGSGASPGVSPAERLGLAPGGFCLFTVHRAENTASPERLRPLLEVLRRAPLPMVFPVHPRTRGVIADFGLEPLLDAPHVRVVAPLSYTDTLRLAAAARAVVTDSGGLQKEAFYVGVPCVTLRLETEWTETVDLGWNRLVGRDVEAALGAIEAAAPGIAGARPYGDGHAGEAIARLVAGTR